MSLRRPQRSLGLPLAILALLSTSCASGTTPEATGSPPPDRPTHTTSVDPAARPSIDDTFVVAAGGRRLALVCWGTGSPTVLLETGGANIEEWTGSGIVDELAGRARVCAYDRAGTGRSDAAPDERRDADDVVTEAHALLEAARVDGPLVLLGRSFGGMIATHWADVRPQGVIGSWFSTRPPRRPSSPRRASRGWCGTRRETPSTSTLSMASRTGSRKTRRTSTYPCW